MLVVIDMQKAFDDPRMGRRNNPRMEEKVAELLEEWRRREAPLVNVRHLSTAPNGLFAGEGAEFKPGAVPKPGETVIEKNVNSAFIGTDFEDRLRSLGCETVVIAGLTTDHCCSTTARMAANLGFETLFVSDATATFDRPAPDGSLIDAETMHRTALASLNGEFARILTTHEVIESLPRR